MNKTWKVTYKNTVVKYFDDIEEFWDDVLNKKVASCEAGDREPYRLTPEQKARWDSYGFKK